MLAKDQNAVDSMNAACENLGHSVPFYRSKIGPRLRPLTRALFEKYCGLSDSELETHLYAIACQLSLFIVGEIKQASTRVVKSAIKPTEDMGWMRPGSLVLRFTATRQAGFRTSSIVTSSLLASF